MFCNSAQAYTDNYYDINDCITNNNRTYATKSLASILDAIQILLIIKNN